MAGLMDKARSSRDKLFSMYETKRLAKKRYIIITNNCWGYELYQSTDREYNTPFVGLFLFPECYLRFLENFHECINSRLRFTQQSKYFKEFKSYPIGVLGNDIEIHFLHYNSVEAAFNKWEQRVARFNEAIAAGTGIYFKLCDTEGCNPAQLKRFHALPFKHKLSLGLQKYNHKNHLHVPYLRNKTGTSLVDGAKLFKKRYTYFDITQWLLTGEITKTPRSRIFSLLP
ncbi:MAG: DUF1919 domain-containing protein [Pseudomonadota bacterium]